MTDPLSKVDPNPIDTSNDQGAIDNLSKLAAGNTALITHPHLMTALISGNATYQQAQAINVFVNGMTAAGRVAVAQQTGTKAVLSSDEQTALGQLNIDPGNNFQSPAQAEADAKQKLKDQVNAQLHPKTSGGWSFGRVFHDVTHNPVTNALGEAYNYSSTAFSGNANQENSSPQMQEAVRAAGYDPSSFWSRQAYQASGLNLGDDSELVDLYKNQDPAQVDQAIKFTDDPKGYIENIVNQPNATAEQIADQLNALNAQPFQDLVKQVGGRRATVGTEITRDLQIDPVQNPELFKYTAAGIDITASFLIDPTLLVLSGYKGIRATQIALDGIGDTEKVKKILSGVQRGPFASQVRNGVQTLLDNSNAIRTAVDAGDDAGAAAAFARVRNLVPGLQHLLPDFLGDNGSKLSESGHFLPGPGKPITTMAEASDYLSSKVGVIRLFAGRPPAEVALMPGALSKFGVKQLRSSLATKLTTHGVGKGLKAVTIDLTKPGVAEKILPSATDAVDAASGRPLAEMYEETEEAANAAPALASQARAADSASAIAKGNATFASRKGLLNPFSVANRAKLFAQRWGSYLPRDVTFATDDPNTVKKVFQYANMYLTRSDANLIAAKYAAGDEGARKAILSALQLQTMHAAGLGTSEAGKAIIDAASTAFNTEKYSMTAGHIADPASGLERDAALLPGQVNKTIQLTNFRDLQKYAAKIGIFETTIGRAFNAQITDHVLSLVRTGWLTTFSNVIRNAGEDLFGAWTRGELVGALRAKAAAGEKDLLPTRDITNAILSPIKRTKAGNAILAPVAKVGSLYRQGVIKLSSADSAARLRYIAEIDPAELATFSDNYVATHLKSMVDPAGVGDADEIQRSGLLPTRMRFNRVGFGEQATEGLQGSERLSAALSIAINKNPDLINAILDHLAAPSAKEFAEAEPEVEEAIAKAAPAEPPTPSGPPTDDQVEAKVAAAIKALESGPHEWVILSRLRDHLGESVNRTQLDRVLTKMSAGAYNIVPESNQKMLTAADRESAVTIGGQQKHLIMRDPVHEPYPGTETAAGDAPLASLYDAGPAAEKAAPRKPVVTAAPPVDITHVIDTLKADPRTAQMTRAGLFVGSDGKTRRAVTAAEKQLALHQLAEKQITEIKYLMSGQDGNLNQALTSFVRANGKAPDAEWVMRNLASDAARPKTVLAPMYEAVPVAKGVNGIVASLNDVSGKVYKSLIEKPIARISSMPIFLDNYGKQRVFMAGWEQQLVDGGMTKEAANRAATDIGMRMAFDRTLKYIDDPTLRTQMDVVGRNFFAFSRATQGFLRRWGTQFVENPAQMRKAMLAMEASQRTGLVYTDENGQKQFVFPGSGAAIDGIMKIADVIPGVDLLRVAGVSPNMTGKFAFLSPGLQNPLQMSLTPMANIPMRAVFELFPQHKIGLDQVDEFFNGTQGQGASAFAELEPTAIKKFTDALNGDDKDSLQADAMRSAMLNLAAAGKIPPAGADSAQIQEFLSNLQVQTKNQLVARAIFGFFTPAPPGVPSEDTSGSSADWFYGATGIHGLDNEYKALLNDAGGDPGKAGQIWAALHPDKQFYTTPTTDNGTKSATLQATKASQAWISANLGFMKDYKGVAAYFVPPAVQTGDFDLGAYNAELQLGLRQHKSTEEFYGDVATANAASMYYTSIATRDAAIQADPGAKTSIMSQFSDWEQSFYSINPLFAQTQTDFSVAQTTAQDQLAQLRRMVASPTSLPTDVPVGEVDQMVAAYDTYHSAISQYPTQTNDDQFARAQIAGQYNAWWLNEVQQNPALAGLYAGVFRTLDNKVLDPIGSSGS